MKAVVYLETTVKKNKNNKRRELFPVNIGPTCIYGSYIFPEPAAPSPSFNAVVMGRRVAVVQKKLCWSDALMYCREHYWDLLSVRSEQEQRGLEEVLRNTTFLTNDPSVSSGHVWLGLRRYPPERQASLRVQEL